jgi:hypothetical protein
MRTAGSRCRRDGAQTGEAVQHPAEPELEQAVEIEVVPAYPVAA